MKVSFFIDRPVFSAVISILIVIVGIIGLTMLPIDQYPQITPPVVKISASYPGASAPVSYTHLIRRKTGIPDAKELAAMIRESQFQKAELKRMEKMWKEKIASLLA